MKIFKFKLSDKFYIEKGTDLYIIDLHSRTELKYNIFTQKASSILRSKHNEQTTVKEFIKRLHKNRYELSQTIIDVLKLNKTINYQSL